MSEPMDPEQRENLSLWGGLISSLGTGFLTYDSLDSYCGFQFFDCGYFWLASISILGTMVAMYFLVMYFESKQKENATLPRKKPIIASDEPKSMGALQKAFIRVCLTAFVLTLPVLIIESLVITFWSIGFGLGLSAFIKGISLYNERLSGN